MTAETGISFIASALLRMQPTFPQFRAEAPASDTTKTELMRRALRGAGSAGMRARSLAIEAGLANSGLVGALLKYDMARGHVLFADGHYYHVEGGCG